METEDPNRNDLTVDIGIKLEKAFANEMFEAGWMLKYDKNEHVREFYNMSGSVVNVIAHNPPAYVAGDMSVEFCAQGTFHGYKTKHLDDNKEDRLASHDTVLCALKAVDKVNNYG